MLLYGWYFFPVRGPHANLGEAYNGALVQLQQAQADVEAAQARLDDLEARLQSQRTAAAAFASFELPSRAAAISSSSSFATFLPM